MINKFFEQVGGIIRVRLQGKNLEKIINMALARGIFLNDIARKEDGLHFKVRSSAYTALKNIADEQGYNLEVTDEQGLPFYQALIRRRLGFVTGAFIFIVALYLLSSFVWFIDVAGSKKVDSDLIILTAARYGVYQGAAKWSFSSSKVEEGILKDIDQLSYVRVDIRGVKARIEVVEKILPRSEITGPCHLVASRDGVVEQVLVLDGQAEVAEGDVIANGDILISGVVFPKPSPYVVQSEDDKNNFANQMPYTVRARGQVKARVWHEGYGECKLYEEYYTNGRETSRCFLETPWNTITVKRGSRDEYVHVQTLSNKKIINTPVGQFVIHKLELTERIKNVRERSESAAVETARKRAISAMQRKASPGLNFENIKVEVLSAPSDPIIRVKVSAETVQDVAVPEPIVGPENSQQ